MKKEEKIESILRQVSVIKSLSGYSAAASMALKDPHLLHTEGETLIKQLHGTLHQKEMMLRLGAWTCQDIIHYTNQYLKNDGDINPTYRIQRRGNGDFI